MKHSAQHRADYNDPAQEFSRLYAEENYPLKRKRKTRKRRLIKGVLLSLLSIFVVIAGALAIYVNVLQNRLGSNGNLAQSIAGLLTERKAPSDPFYVLLLGTDGRPGESKYRSDTIILARINPADKQITLVSIPRDIPVEIPGHGRQKINAAHAFGGPSQAIKSVSEFCGVPITHYIEVSFEGFQSLVDALGGVEVNVPVKINDKDAGTAIIEPGLQVLNGDQALTFCRSRKFKDGDFSRMRHQRLFIEALAKKVLNDSNLVDMAKTLDSLSKMVITDMSVSEILDLMQQFSGFDPANIYTGVVPSDPRMIGGVAYVVPNLVEWTEMMRRVDAGLSPSESEAEKAQDAKEANARQEKKSIAAEASNKQITVAIKNGSRLTGAGTTASNILKRANFTVSGVGDIDDRLYDESVILYRNNKGKEAADKIAAGLGFGTVKKDTGETRFNGDLCLIVGTDWARK